jgi:hypothetical protein
MTTQTLKLAGKCFVIVEESQFRINKGDADL